MSQSLGGRWAGLPSLRRPSLTLLRHSDAGSSSDLLGITFNSHAFPGTVGQGAAICLACYRERKWSEWEKLRTKSEGDKSVCLGRHTTSCCCGFPSVCGSCVKPHMWPKKDTSLLWRWLYLKLFLHFCQEKASDLNIILLTAAIRKWDNCWFLPCLRDAQMLRGSKCWKKNFPHRWHKDKWTNCWTDWLTEWIGKSPLEAMQPGYGSFLVFMFGYSLALNREL